MKQRSILYFLSILLVCSQAIQAQSIKLLSEKTDAVIEDAFVEYRTYGDKKSNYTTSSFKGLIELKAGYPIIVSITHLNYLPLVDTLLVQPNAIQLTPKNNQLEEVVVTGQIDPQSARNSVYQIKSIDKKRIEAQGATDISEVLRTNLNIQFNRDNALGSSNISLLGLSGQYTKILINGIPVVGRSGVSNEVDLSQIDINSIERIEIVEGPLSVEYGSDALAGVINIITKQHNTDKPSLNLSLHEESIGNSYSTFSEGIHNPSIQASILISDKISIKGGSRLYYFGGWQGNQEGRQLQWHPKTTWFNHGSILYDYNDLELSYELDLMNQRIKNLGAAIIDANGQDDPFARDEHYVSERWMHRLHINKNFNGMRFNNFLSFTDYHRNTENFRNYLIPGLEDDRSHARIKDSTTFKALFYRGTLSRKLFRHPTNVLNMQLGLESNSSWAGGSKLSSGDKFLQEWASYLVLEYELFDKLKIKPGIRYFHSSIFGGKPTGSIHLQYDNSSGGNFKLGYGRGYRTPSLRELYHEFIDNNHNIIGNENLTPEFSHSFVGSYDQLLFNKQIKTSLSAFYTRIYDQITYVTSENSNDETTYRNVDEFQTNGINFTLSHEAEHLQFSSGLSYIGRYQDLAEVTNDVPQYLYAPEYNTNLTYHLSNWNTSLSLFYKLTGSRKSYRQNAEGDIDLQKINAFHWIDLTIKQPVTDYLWAQFGVKNLLDISTIQSTASSGGAHSSNSDGKQSVAYGRSYFIKLNFQFNQFKK